MSGKLIFITGGIRSGKSNFAEQLSSQLGSQVTYVATARVFDDETRHRVELHKVRRPAGWTTVEEPIDVTSVINRYGSNCEVMLLDCLTMLITNLIFSSPQEDHHADSLSEPDLSSCEPDLSRERQGQILDQIRGMAEAAKNVAANVIVVSNEVGMTLVSENFLGRQYQEIVGRANQIVASFADEAYLVVAGYPIHLKNGGE